MKLKHSKYSFNQWNISTIKNSKSLKKIKKAPEEEEEINDQRMAFCRQAARPSTSLDHPLLPYNFKKCLAFDLS
jgi:hypothetical protein